MEEERTLLVSTYEVAAEALAELKHASSVGQRPGDVERLTT